LSLAGGVLTLAACASNPPATANSAPASPAPNSATATGVVTLNIKLVGGKVTPNGDKIDIRRGQTVKINVLSDHDDEVHVHTSGAGFELAVKANQPASGRFVADEIGSFEVESHHPQKIIAILNVR
jgi:hypothetical protein